MPVDLKALIKKAQNKGAQEAEIYFSSSKTTKIDVLNGKVESKDLIGIDGIGIRVIKNKQLGFAHTSDLSQEILEETLEQALKNSENTPPDKFNSLPEKAEKVPELDLYDPQIAKVSIDQKTEFALKAEEAAYAHDKRVKKTEKVSYSDSEYTVRIINSHGLDLSYRGNNCSLFCDIIAEHGMQADSGFGMQDAKKIRDLDPQEVGKEAAERACALLGARLISSQKLPLVLDPYIGAQVLAAISPILSSDNVQKGKSLFINKLGKTVATNKFTLIDDGRLKGGLASVPFDDEGVLTQENKLIENGILKGYFYNTYTANKEKKSSTGNGHRPAYSEVPDISPSNLYIKPGRVFPEILLKKVSKGLYVTRVMGMHTVNPITGDFSIGAAGLIIKNGKKTYPVRGITIAGNLMDLLRSIEEVATDLRFFPISANLGCPTLLISGLSVSGA